MSIGSSDLSTGFSMKWRMNLEKIGTISPRTLKLLQTSDTDE